MRRFSNARWNDPALYHLVVNTAYVPVPVAVELIVAASQALVELSEGKIES